MTVNSKIRLQLELSTVNQTDDEFREIEGKHWENHITAISTVNTRSKEKPTSTSRETTKKQLSESDIRDDRLVKGSVICSDSGKDIDSSK